MIDGLSWRGAYALVGIKGGPALAEDMKRTTEGYAVAVGLIEDPAETTTTTSPFCAMLNCPAGLMLKRDSMWSVRSTAENDCCITAAAAEGVAVVGVRSAGWADGSEAVFLANGVDFHSGPSRGLTVVTVRPNGTLIDAATFDTMKSGSDALAAYIIGIENGTMVLIGARDEAATNLTDTAKAAIKTCGATMIDGLSWRGAYALVGIKGGPALAEEMKRTTEGYAVAFGFLGQTEVVTTSTTTTTTSTASWCAMLTCPLGMLLKRDIMWSVRSADESDCCAAAAEDAADIGVRSAGWADGREVIFFANGVNFYSGSSRGLTVVTVGPNGTRIDSATFDTMTSGSDALAAYINDIEHGTVVLIGVRDEASKNLTDTAKAAMKTCGATMIDGLSLRGAYALVGIKGGPALAEDIKRTTEGYAVAVARMEVVFSPTAKMPICHANVPVLPVEGYFSQGNLNLDAGCRYNLYETAQATQCLQGRWIVLTGSSNTLLEFGNLVNLLAPDEYHIRRDGEMTDTSAAVDAVIENGQVTHWETISNELPECRQVDIAVANQNRAECKKAIESLLVRAPAFSAGSVRITFLLSYFWYRTSLALEVVGEDTLWSSAEVAVVTQVGAWYSVCVAKENREDREENEDNEDSCPRKELLAMDRDPAIQVFKDEMEEVFWQMDSFCTGGGRAATLGCNVQTISWANEVRDNENFQVMNSHIEQAMAVRQSSSFRLIDFFRLGGTMPEEVVEGHGSQMLNLWVWTVMFNAMCPAGLAARGAYAVWEGNLCSGTEARFENCPDYSSSCLNGRCKKWECMNSVPCTLTVTDLPLVGNTEGLCDDRINITESLADPILTDEPVDLDACHRGSLRARLWCLQDVEWLLPLVSVIAALCIVGVQYAWEASRQKATRQSLESSKEDRPEARAVEADNAVTIQVHDEVDMFDVGQEVPQEKPSADASKLRATNWEFAEDVMSAAPSAMKPKPHIELDVNSEANEAALDLNKPECHANAEEHLEKPRPLRAHRAPSTLEAREAEESGAMANTGRLAQMLQTRKAGHRYPVGLACFMGSTHVVLGHLFEKGATHPVYFFRWGFTWVPCFFMLSGFILFSAYLKNPKEETMIQYVLRRSTAIYPLYAFSLIPAFIMQKILGTMSADWPTLLAQSFLLQAWWPTFTENALQMHCWFLSCMVVYWFFFKPLAYCLKNLTLKKTSLLMVFFFVLPWLLVLVPVMANQPVDWYRNHDFLSIDTALDIGVVMLKFHPVCYFHVFILGMLLAKLRQLLDKKALTCGHAADSLRNPYLIALQFLAPLGYLLLTLVFSMEGFQARLWGYKLSARISVLLPFQAMILFGLAGLPSLPLPLFSYAFSKMDFLENYSYAVYVFQFLGYAVWPQTGLVNLPLFLIFTYASAAVIARAIQQPIQKWWASHTKARLVVPFILAAFLVGLSFLPDPAATLPDIPAQKWIDDRTKDMRLELTDSDGQHLGAVIINPSLAVVDGQVVVVARRHRRETTQSNGRYRGPEGEEGDAVIINQIWHSDVVVGSRALDVELWEQWPSSGLSPLAGLPMQAWTGLRTSTGGNWQDLCIAETWIASNSTLIRHAVTGPEDPKVVSLRDTGLVIAFDSLPPRNGDQSTCRSTSQGFADGVTQMYLSTGVEPAQLGTPSSAYRLSYGKVDVAEKNWIPFVYQESLFFIYTPLPHVVLTSQNDGQSGKAFSTTFRPLQRVVQENPHIRIRGSAQAVFVNKSQETPSLPRPHYLALLQIFDTSTGRSAHHAYRFGAEPPFVMLQLSSQLPLTEAAASPGGVPFAFASGLAVHNSSVVVTYGAGDRDARALIMSLDRLDDMFACSTYADA